jgi:hypothetical protein
LFAQYIQKAGVPQLLEAIGFKLQVGCRTFVALQLVNLGVVWNGMQIAKVNT